MEVGRGCLKATARAVILKLEEVRLKSWGGRTKTNLCGVCEGGEAAPGMGDNQSLCWWNWGQLELRAGGGKGTELLSGQEVPPDPSTYTLEALNWCHSCWCFAAQSTFLGGDWRPEVEPWIHFSDLPAAPCVTLARSLHFSALLPLSGGEHSKWFAMLSCKELYRCRGCSASSCASKRSHT